MKVFLNNRKWEISNLKVNFKNKQEEMSQFVGTEGKQWWLDFERKWEHIEIINFEEVDIPQEQIDRLNQVNSMEEFEDDYEKVEYFILNGVFPKTDKEKEEMQKQAQLKAISERQDFQDAVLQELILATYSNEEV